MKRHPWEKREEENLLLSLAKNVTFPLPVGNFLLAWNSIDRKLEKHKKWITLTLFISIPFLDIFSVFHERKL